MKAWLIAWQDTVIRLRDRNAFILMLLAPLIITAIMGAALGRVVTSQDSTDKGISVALVNEDKGELGTRFARELGGSGFLNPRTAADPASARKMVEEGEAYAVVLIAHNLSDNLAARAGEASGNTDARSVIQLHTPAPLPEETTRLIRQEVTVIANRLSAETLGRRISIEQIKRPDLALVAGAANSASASQNGDARGAENSVVGVKVVDAGNKGTNSNPFAFFAPSMAIFFLMFSMFDAPRNILAETDRGTLGRLMRTPTGTSQILLGKLGGSFLTGILQFIVLVVASRLIFNLTWGGSIAGLLLMVVAVVAAASGMGAIIAAVSKNVNQADVLGSGIAIVSAGLGGAFFPPDRLPDWLQVFSFMTVNRWGLEGFTDLTIHNLGFTDILLDAGVLLAIAFVLFTVAFWRFKQKLSN